jgi:hypothetical protein
MADGATLLRLSRTEERAEVLKSKHIFTVIFALIGAALLARGVAEGVWPLTIQLVGGVLLLGYAVARWRIL